MFLLYLLHFTINWIQLSSHICIYTQLQILYKNTILSLQCGNGFPTQQQENEHLITNYRQTNDEASPISN